MNEILLRRKNKVIIEKGENTEDTRHYVATMAKNIEYLGFAFSKDLFEALEKLKKEDLFDFYRELVDELKKMIGANVTYMPMYPSFPHSVMEMSYAELYINAIVHYWSNGVLYPETKKDERLPLFDVTKVKVIDLGTEKDLHDIFNNLCNSKTSISFTDKEDIAWMFKNLNVVLPDEIPLKENVALIGKLYLECNPLASAKDIQKYFKTATDVLRLITAMSDGDISLAENTKYRNFKRSERKLLLELLDNCRNIEEDMLRYKNRWIRVGEKLHPGEYNQFKKASAAFYKLRNDVKIETFAGEVSKSLNERRYQKALDLLKKRPGELARKLDHLLRISSDKDAVVKAFEEVATSVSTPVLLQVREHFLHRHEDLTHRVFFPKGNLARAHSEMNTLMQIDETICMSVVSVCEAALIENYKNKEPMGKVFLSEDFKNYVVPFSQRSASKALKTIVRGSRIPIEDTTNVLRAFIWWTNTTEDKDDGWHNPGRVDIDLSATVFGESWNYLTHVSYTHLKDRQFKLVHSGDIVNGGPMSGKGASEFLDVDINAIVKNGGRYVVFQVYDYTNTGFCNLPNAMFGWMARQEANSGEIYEPKTVKQKMDMSCKSYVCVPVIFDCVKRELIWADMGISMESTQYNRGGNNLESNIFGVTATCYGVVNMQKPNLYDLILLNVKARGELMENKEDADIVFDIDEGITPYDLDLFVGEYL